MDQTRAWIYFIILTLSFFGLLFSQTTKTEISPQPDQQIVQTPNSNNSQVLMGGEDDPCLGATINIKNNNFNPTNVNAVYDNSTKKYCAVFLLYYHPGSGYEPQRTLVADYTNWSKTLCGTGGCEISAYRYYSNSGTYKYHLQSNLSAKATIYAGVSADNQAPTAPSNLRTTSVESTSATLSWNASTDNKGVSGYKIYRNSTLVFTTTYTSFTDSPLNPGKTYSYYVKAYDAAGNLSSASNTVAVKTSLTVKDISLPKIFTQKGASTTNLAKIKDLKKVKSFTIEVKDKNKIVWNELVDLSSQDTANKFKSLDKYLKATKLGVIDLDSKSLKTLDKKAIITMFNLPFISTPAVLVDGKEDPKIISNINYEKGKLVFNTVHFSKLEAVPTLEITNPQNNFSVNKAQTNLTGKIGDPEATVTLSLNNKDLGEMAVATNSGEFSKELTLEKGKNTIIVTAKSLFGATQSATITGDYSPRGILIWIFGVATLAIVGGLGMGGYILYKKRKTKSSEATKPRQTEEKSK